MSYISLLVPAFHTKETEEQEIVNIKLIVFKIIEKNYLRTI